MDLTRKCQEFMQKHKQQKAFDKLKKQVLQEPILIQFNSNKETIVKTNISNITIDRYISQEGPTRKL